MMKKNEIKLDTFIPTSVMNKLNSYCKSHNLSIEDVLSKAVDRYMTLNCASSDKCLHKTP